MFGKAMIRRYLVNKLGAPEIPGALERLVSLGVKPSLIFDVGAYRGYFTRLCLKIWLGARIACFEPLKDKVIELEKLASSNPAIHIFPVLLGAESHEKVPLHESKTASSILEEHVPQNFPVNSYPMKTIDQIVREDFKGQCPDLLKIDVQGYEMEVLKGAEESLKKTQILLIELDLLDIHKDVTLAGDVVGWLNDRQWIMYDICELHRRPLDKALWQADFIFVPATSPLRADKRWASGDQK